MVDFRRFQEAAIADEMAGEKAGALGRTARAMEAELAALTAFDAAPRPEQAHPEKDRLELVREAAYAAWIYFVQRESIGVRDHREAIELYGLPREVLNRMGEMPKSKRLSETPSVLKWL